jgi:uncharacterized protein YjiS (DUF1127 family)
MTTDPSAIPLTRAALPFHRAASVRWILALMRVWHTRARSRRQLRELDDRALSDIGLTRSDACWEADKPFWR